MTLALNLGGVALILTANYVMLASNLMLLNLAFSIALVGLAFICLAPIFRA